MDVSSEAEMSPYFQRFFVGFYNPSQAIITELNRGGNFQVSLGGKRVFNGKIERVTDIYQAAERNYLAYGIDWASYNLMQTTIHNEFRNQTVTQIARDICDESGIDYDLDESTIKLEYCNFNGWLAWDCLDWLFRGIGWFWFVYGNKLRAFEIPPIKKSVYRINKETGLRGVEFLEVLGPEFIQRGYKVTTALKPEIKPGDILALQSTKITGSFYVLRAVHKKIWKGSVRSEFLVLSPQTKLMRARSFFKSELERFSAEIARREIFKNNQVESGMVSANYPSNQQSDIVVNRITDFSVSRLSIDRKHDGGTSLSQVPISTPFAHDKAGLVFPQHPNMSLILLKMLGRKDDHFLANSYWNKDAEIPSGLDNGDFRFDVPIYRGSRRESKNAQTQIDRQGNASLNMKSLRLNVKSDARGLNRPTNAGQYKIEMDADEIKLGFSATLGAARDTDSVDIFGAFLTWLNSHVHPSPGTPPATPFTGPQIGNISSASSKTKVE